MSKAESKELLFNSSERKLEIAAHSNNEQNPPKVGQLQICFPLENVIELCILVLDYVKLYYRLLINTTGSWFSD